MKPPIGAIAIGEPHIFFPRMRRWEDEQLLPRRPHGLQHELFHARQQIDMRSRSNFHLAAWVSYWESYFGTHQWFEIDPL